MFTFTNANKEPLGNSSKPKGVLTPNSVLIIKNCWMCISANSFLLSCSKLKAVSLLFNTILSANCSIVSLLNLTKNSLPFMLRYIGKSATISAPANILLSSLWVLNLKSLCSLNAIQLRCIAGFSTNAVASIPWLISSIVSSIIGSSTSIKQLTFFFIVF